MTAINLYLCFLIQNAMFDYTITHNKCSSLVLTRTIVLLGTLQDLCGQEFTSTHPPHSDH